MLMFTGVLDSSSGQVPSVRQEGLDEIICRRQLELIEELTAFVGRLNKVLSSRPVSSSKHGSTYLKEDGACKVSQKQFAYRKVRVLVDCTVFVVVHFQKEFRIVRAGKFSRM